MAPRMCWVVVSEREVAYDLGMHKPNRVFDMALHCGITYTLTRGYWRFTPDAVEALLSEDDIAALRLRGVEATFLFGRLPEPITTDPLLMSPLATDGVPDV